MTPVESPIHAEKQNAIFRIPLVIVVAGVLLFGAWQIREQQWQSALLTGMAIIAGGVIWGLTQFSIEVFPGEIRFGFPLWRKRFSIRDVHIGDVETIPFAAGIGIHFWRRHWVYNARLGRGLILKTGQSNYLLGSNDPERLQHVLLGIAARKVTP